MPDEYQILMCMFQMKAKGLIVEDCNHKFEMEGRRSRHYIVSPESGIEFPLDISGIISYLPFRIPNQGG